MAMNEPHERLKWAREKAGYAKASDAARALGIEEPTYFGHENGSRGLSRSGRRYAEFFRVSFDWLMTGRGAPPAGADVFTPADRAVSTNSSPSAREPTSARIAPEADSLVVGERDIPIMGTTVGGSEGEFYLNGETVDYARRLPGIAKRKNVFGVYIESTSMSPRFEPGELVYASPSPPPKPGDDVLIELAPISGERAGPSYIKRLVRRSGNRVICQQFNPAVEVEYDARHVKAIYRIIPLAELAGF